MLQQQIMPELAKQLILEKQLGQNSAYIHLNLGEQGLTITLSDKSIIEETAEIDRDIQTEKVLPAA